MAVTRAGAELDMRLGARGQGACPPSPPTPPPWGLRAYPDLRVCAVSPVVGRWWGQKLSSEPDWLEVKLSSPHRQPRAPGQITGCLVPPVSSSEKQRYGTKHLE